MGCRLFRLCRRTDLTILPGTHFRSKKAEPSTSCYAEEHMIRVTAVTSLIASAATYVSCQTPPPPPPKDLTEGALVILEMMSPHKLDAAGFYRAYPDPKPSDFVSFINSDLGAILWPPRADSPFADDSEIEQSRAIGETVIPKGIAFKRNRPDPDGGRQIVYRDDDQTGEIVVEAYIDPMAEPIFTRRWTLRS